MPEAYCGGCQQQLKMGHRAGCPALAQEIVLNAPEMEGQTRCMECGRVVGHAMDCSEVTGRYGIQLGGW